MRSTWQSLGLKRRPVVRQEEGGREERETGQERARVVERVEDLLGRPKNLRAGGVAQRLKMLTPPP